MDGGYLHTSQHAPRHQIINWDISSTQLQLAQVRNFCATRPAFGPLFVHEATFPHNWDLGFAHIVGPAGELFRTASSEFNSRFNGAKDVTVRRTGAVLTCRHL